MRTICKRVIESIRESDPSFDVELTGFMEDEIARLYDEKPEDDVETVPRMEIQAFEHHDYLVFMFHDLRDWMLALQLLGVREVDFSITRKTKKIGIGRVLHGKRHPRTRPPRCRRRKSTCSPRRTGRNWPR